MLALFRIVEPSGGAIVIDGLDTATMGLSDLRSRWVISNTLLCFGFQWCFVGEVGCWPP